MLDTKETVFCDIAKFLADATTKEELHDYIVGILWDICEEDETYKLIHEIELLFCDYENENELREALDNLVKNHS